MPSSVCKCCLCLCEVTASAWKGCRMKRKYIGWLIFWSQPNNGQFGLNNVAGFWKSFYYWIELWFMYHYFSPRLEITSAGWLKVTRTGFTFRRSVHNKCRAHREKLRIDLYAMECFRRNGSNGCFGQNASLLVHVLGHFYFNLKDSPFNNLWYRVKMMHFTQYLEMHNSLKALVH